MRCPIIMYRVLGYLILLLTAAIVVARDSNPDLEEYISDYQVDLGYCIDRHQSISVPEWSQMLQFISNFSIYANIESSGSRVGLVSFDEISTMDIRLDKHDNVFDLQTDILSQVHSGQGRDISVGIYRLRVDLFQKDNGDQSGVSNVAILITNGASDFDWAAREAKLYRDTGATLISIGVGPDVDWKLLTNISGSEYYAFHVDTFLDLPSLTLELRGRIARNTVTMVPCSIDVCVAIDRHESINTTSWDLTLQYVAQLAWFTDLDITQNRFGLVSFDLASTLDIPMNKHQNFTALVEEILEQPHGGTGRAIDQALLRMRVDCFNSIHGNREGVDNVAILVTNGDSDFNSAASEAEQLRDSGVLVLTVGVGSGINEELLINISTNGLENCIHVESFTELAQSPDVTLNNMCPTQSTKESPTEVTDNTLIIILCCTIIPIGVAAMVAGIVLGIQKNKTKKDGRSVAPDVRPESLE